MTDRHLPGSNVERRDLKKGGGSIAQAYEASLKNSQKLQQPSDTHTQDLQNRADRSTEDGIQR